jgi:hypothetical protein
MKQTEIVGKVFVVVGGKRRCLVCEKLFPPEEAAAHATAPCSAVVIERAEKSVC